MGATVVGSTIYVDCKLNAKLNRRERRVLYAHEIAHYIYKHRIWLFFVAVFCLFIPRPVNAFKRFLEIRADRYALRKTRDPDAFISLMGKLVHSGPSHPSRDYRINLARTI